MTISDVASTAASTIGRYFSLVSLVPSAAFASFVYLLVKSGSWSGSPNWAAAFTEASNASLGEISLFLIASVILGLVLHPLQFTLVQLYEGYWGRSFIARRLWLARTTVHAQHALHAARSIDYIEGHPELSGADRELRDGLWVSGGYVELGRITGSYPPRLPEAEWPYMPTRLGNVLRRYELISGAPYGISSVQAIPYLALVAEERDVRYLDDQRSTLDLIVRLSAMAFGACGISITFLWNDGLWLLLALVPYVLGYLLYRGAVAVAHEYGVSMAALIALNRTELYQRLGLASPPDADAERKRNIGSLRYLLDLDRRAPATYVNDSKKDEA